MGKRTITSLFIAAVFVFVVIGSIKLHYMIFHAFCMLIMIGGALEVCRALKCRHHEPFKSVVLVACVTGYIVFFIINWLCGDILISVAAFLSVLVAGVLASMIWAQASKTRQTENALSTMLALFYPCAIVVFMLAISYLDDLHKGVAIILIFTVSPLSDVMAYLVGSTLKGKKLCPKISPKKTISGAIGGLVGGLIGGAFMILITTSTFFSWLGLAGGLGDSSAANIIHCLVLGFIGSICTQAGDIIASYIKRKCLIKDFGTLLPGHGGIMDRVDGMIINAAFLFIYMSIISVIL